VSKSISEHAYAELAHAIATCELRPGSPINERTDAARLGMSRTPFRQALHRLQLEGLVVSVPKRGTYVMPLDPDDIEDNMRVREAIETDMVQKVISESRPVDIKGLDANLRAQRDAVEHDDFIDWLRLDEEFHIDLLAASGNARAVEAVRRCWLHVNRVRYIRPLSRSAQRLALSQHREILAAVRSADVERARSAIRKHLEQPLQRNLASLAAELPEAFHIAGNGAAPADA